jgi:hypothetical protein
MSDYREITGPAERTPEQARAQAEADSAARIETLAEANLKDAETGLALARLALERATENRRAAFRAAYGTA